MTNIYYIIIAVLTIAISPVIALSIERLSSEKKVFEKGFMKSLKFDIKVAVLLLVAVSLAYAQYKLSVDFVAFATVGVGLVMAALIDIKSQIIPNELNFSLGMIGLCYAYYNLIVAPVQTASQLLGMITGLLIFLAIEGFSLLVFKREGMGGGDIKLMGVLGLFFGFQNIIQIFVLCFLFGAIISIILLAAKIKKTTDHIPFGPNIVLAAFVTMVLPASTLIPTYLEIIGKV